MVIQGESAEYRAARDRLLEREIELRRMMESVAEDLRALPPGPAVLEDYVFREMTDDGSVRPVRLSELFGEGKGSLIVYNMMFPRYPADDRPGRTDGPFAILPKEAGPCPSCVALLDQLDGAVLHLRDTRNFAVVAKAPIERVMLLARERGWKHLRLLSAADTNFKRDMQAEDETGAQLPMMNVFERCDGVVRHVWSSEMLHAPSDPGQDSRHTGTVEPLWTLMDLTREGRLRNWEEQLQYPR